MVKKSELPSMKDLLAFMNENNADKRDVAKAFHIKGDDRIKLKEMIRELKQSGSLVPTPKNKDKNSDKIPENCPCIITGLDSEGYLIARPMDWTSTKPMPQIIITDCSKIRPAPTTGDEILVKLTPVGKNTFDGKVLRKISDAPNQIVGVYDGSTKTGRIVSVDRRINHTFAVSENKGAKNGDVVICELQGSIFDSRTAKIKKVIGKSTDAHCASLIATAIHGIKTEFSLDELKAAKKLKLPSFAKRTDLRTIPLVTIDGEDARDFDDAVFAEPTENGFHIIVAIADVAFFVTSRSVLDSCAYSRGNSVYFPDRCIPMLPTELSTDLCSLKPNEDRPCIAVHLYINKSGKLEKHKFVRAVMRSAARLNYHEVQDVFSNKNSPLNEELKRHILDLKSAYEVLAVARKERNSLELDVPEREIYLSADGKIKNIKARERLDSHKMIEEMMILANVAAATALEEHEIPTLYRIHEPPSPEKKLSLKTSFSQMNISLKKGDQEELNKIISLHEHDSASFLINELILRSQSQARYCPENVGHFGLALEKYVHFTSPIRRYADLTVHRGLIKALNLGADGLEDEDIDLTEIGEHISYTERQAKAAERDAEDRYLANYMASHIGEQFTAIISSVNQFGLFVRLDETNAEGLIPISSLQNDFYDFIESQNALIGTRTKTTFKMGQHVNVLLVEAVPVTGGLLFSLIDSRLKKQSSSKHKQKDKFKNKKRKKK